jgi:Protein of unknown function DUF70.
MEYIWLLFAANVGICIWGFRISTSPAMGRLTKSALNPVLVIWIFLFCCALLYAVYAREGYVFHPRVSFYAPLSAQTFSYLVFTLFALAFAFGQAVASRTVATGSPPLPPKEKTPNGTNTGEAFFVSITVSGVVIAYVTVVFGVTTLSDIQELTADRFVRYRESPLIIYLFMLPYLAFAVYCVKAKSFGLFVVAFLLALAASVISGNRLNLLSLGFAVGVASTMRGKHIPRWLWLAYPCLGPASAISLYYLRGYNAYASVEDLVTASGGWIELLMNPFEFNYHQLLTSVVAMQLDERIPRIPGEAFWAALWLPVPRALMPLKSLSPSIPYSEIVNPEVWYRFSSQATLGVFGDVYLEFGLAAGCVVLFLLGFTWFRWSRPKPGRSVELQAMITTMMLAATIVFVRSGITQVGQLIWSALALYIVYRVLAYLRLPNRRTSPESM